MWWCSADISTLPISAKDWWISRGGNSCRWSRSHCKLIVIVMFHCRITIRLLWWKTIRTSPFPRLSLSDAEVMEVVVYPCGSGKLLYRVHVGWCNGPGILACSCTFSLHVNNPSQRELHLKMYGCSQTYQVSCILHESHIAATRAHYMLIVLFHVFHSSLHSCTLNLVKSAPSPSYLDVSAAGG